MAKQIVALVLVWWAASPALGVELFLLQGQITEGGFYVSGDTVPQVTAPFYVTPESPVAYEAVFSYDAADQVASFYFTPLVDDINGTQLIDENLFPGVVRNDDAALVVDFEPPLQTLMNSFELTLDKASGQGEWSWFETCAVCDRILDPYARATITSYREVLGGDFDADGDVDGADLARWRLGYGSNGYPAREAGDADADLDVDGRDFLIWQRQVSPPAAAAQATPEPASGALLALAAIGGRLSALSRRLAQRR